jgi:hypothetical protein
VNPSEALQQRLRAPRSQENDCSEEIAARRRDFTPSVTENVRAVSEIQIANLAGLASQARIASVFTRFTQEHVDRIVKSSVLVRATTAAASAPARTVRKSLPLLSVESAKAPESAVEAEELRCG